MEQEGLPSLRVYWEFIPSYVHTSYLSPGLVLTTRASRANPCRHALRLPHSVAIFIAIPVDVVPPDWMYLCHLLTKLQSTIMFGRCDLPLRPVCRSVCRPLWELMIYLACAETRAFTTCKEIYGTEAPDHARPPPHGNIEAPGRYSLFTLHADTPADQIERIGPYLGTRILRVLCCKNHAVLHLCDTLSTCS